MVNQNILHSTHCNILVTGISGFLGQYLLPLLIDRHIIGVYNTHKIEVPNGIAIGADLTDSRNVSNIFQSYRINHVIHAAALTGLGLNAVNEYQSQRVNYGITSNIVDNCLKYNSKLIYLSTDVVFSGRKEFYNENDIPDPINIYGKQKFQAEQKILKNLSNYAICRLSKVFGNGTGSIMNIIINNIKNDQETILYNNVFRTPISGLIAAELIVSLIEKGNGVFHLAGPKRLSWFEFGKYVYKFLGLDQTMIKDVEYSPKDNNGSFMPMDLNMQSARLEEFNNSIPPLKDQIMTIINYHNFI